MEEKQAFLAQLAAFTPRCEQEEADLRLMLRCGACFDELLTRENPIAHVTASAWLVTPDRSRVLLAYHNQYQSWAWLGGHADGDGNLLRVALREAREESGLEHVRPVTDALFSIEVLPVAQHIKRGKFVSAHLHLNATYLLEADATEPLHCKPDENSGVRWFRPADVMAAVSEREMRAVYQKLMDRTAGF